MGTHPLADPNLHFSTPYSMAGQAGGSGQGRGPWGPWTWGAPPHRSPSRRPARLRTQTTRSSCGSTASSTASTPTASSATAVTRSSGGCWPVPCRCRPPPTCTTLPSWREGQKGRGPRAQSRAGTAAMPRAAPGSGNRLLSPAGRTGPGAGQGPVAGGACQVGERGGPGPATPGRRLWVCPAGSGEPGTAAGHRGDRTRGTCGRSPRPVLQRPSAVGSA